MKTALITGGSTGIGAKIAEILARNGIFVYLNYLNSNAEAQKVLSKIKKKGGKAYLIPADITNEQEVKEMFQIIQNKSGHLDYLINNAGIALPDSIENYQMTNWKKELEVNLVAKMQTIKYALFLLKKSKSPKIINIASRRGEKATKNRSGYSSAAAGIIMLTRVAAMELSKYKITVNTVSPGVIKTPMTEQVYKDSPKFWTTIAKEIPIGRIGSTEDIAEVVAFLISDKAGYINGANIIVDGGASLVL